jgi:6-pyruvoyltetrahydropterin/6-carboxytetrahydropterin synthase
MYALRKTKQIEASHQLPHHDGKCKGLHGHTWTITLEVKGASLHATGPKRGMLFDYYDLGIIMKEKVESLDHRHLNDIFDNPTSENIAECLFGDCAPLVQEASGGKARLARVLVSETQNSVAEFGE